MICFRLSDTSSSRPERRVRLLRPVRCTQGRMAFIGLSGSVMGLFSIVPDDVCYVRDAFVPLERADGGLVAGARRQGRPAWRSPPHHESRLRASSQTYRRVRRHLLQLCRKAALLHPGDTGGSLGFRHDPLQARVRERRRSSGRHRRVRPSFRSPCGPTDKARPRRSGDLPRTPDAPSGSLGMGINVSSSWSTRPPVRECPPGRLRRLGGHIRNADLAIGEIVSTSGAAGFEGYWRNNGTEDRREGARTAGTGRATSATTDRGRLRVLRRAPPTTGCTSTGRTSHPPRSPVLLERHPDVVLHGPGLHRADPVVGDQVMAALQLRPGLDAPRRRGLLRVPGRGRAISAPSGRPRFVRIERCAARHRHQQGAQAVAARRTVELRRPGPGGNPTRARPYRRGCTAEDAAAARRPPSATARCESVEARLRRHRTAAIGHPRRPSSRSADDRRPMSPQRESGTTPPGRASHRAGRDRARVHVRRALHRSRDGRRRPGGSRAGEGEQSHS